MSQTSYGIEGRPAPELGVDIWLNPPDAKSKVELGDYVGQCLYLYCFQAWCPGCHSHGFPTLLRTMETFEDERHLSFLAVQTVFEGFETNTLEAARRVADKYGLSIPVGHDPGPEREGSTLMKRYRSGGTPWTVLIDRSGKVRFNGFQPDDRALQETIRSLCRE